PASGLSSRTTAAGATGGGPTRNAACARDIAIWRPTEAPASTSATQRQTPSPHTHPTARPRVADERCPTVKRYPPRELITSVGQCITVHLAQRPVVCRLRAGGPLCTV